MNLCESGFGVAISRSLRAAPTSACAEAETLYFVREITTCKVCLTSSQTFLRFVFTARSWTWGSVLERSTSWDRHFWKESTRDRERGCKTQEKNKKMSMPEHSNPDKTIGPVRREISFLFPYLDETLALQNMYVWKLFLFFPWQYVYEKIEDLNRRWRYRREKTTLITCMQDTRKCTASHLVSCYDVRDTHNKCEKEKSFLP